MKNVIDIRNDFKDKLSNKDFIIDKTGVKIIEIIGSQFIADEQYIFGQPNQKYIQKEIQWYESQSSNINDIYGEEREAPVAWKYSANKHGEINSNYGLLIYSDKYNNQYDQVLNELCKNPNTRRASMIYNRPDIWIDFNHSDKNDFICTNSQTFYIRDHKMSLVVQMRSNDIWAGYRNDYAWAKHVLHNLINDYNISTNSNIIIGDIIWQVQSLHCYEKNFNLIEEYFMH